MTTHMRHRQMGRPEGPQGFLRPTAASSRAGATSSDSSGFGHGGRGGARRAPTTAAELLAPWRAKQEEEAAQRRRRRQGADAAEEEEEEIDAEFVGQLFGHTRHLVQWSPNDGGRWLAAAQGPRVVVREAGSMLIEAHFMCAAEVEHMAWGPEGDGLLCANYKKGLVQLFRVSDPSWKCTLSEGAMVGLTSALWAPDGRHVLTTTDFGLALTVWPVLAGTDPAQTMVIRRPKMDVAPAFSPDGALMAVASRLEARDHISLYATGVGRWRPLRTFPADTVDLVALHWAPDGGSLVVQDTNLVYGLHAFAPDGHALLTHYTTATADEGDTGGEENDGSLLGVKSVAFSPDGRLLALGSYDQCLRVLNTLTWQAALTGSGGRHQSPYGAEGQGQGPQCTGNFVGYTEEAPGAGFVEGLPPPLPSVKPDIGKAAPKLGVGLLAWSDDGRFLLSRNDNMPRALFVWDFNGAERGLTAILLFADPVRSARWGPQQQPSPSLSLSHANIGTASSTPQLCIATGGPRFYLWSPSVSPKDTAAAPAWFDIPAADGSFNVTRLRWAPLASSPSSYCGYGDVQGGGGRRRKSLTVWRLEGGGVDGEGEEGDGEEEEGAMLVALMTPEHWCVCALNV